MKRTRWSDLAKRASLGVLAVAIAMVAIEAPLFATPVGVPEIDGASLSAGLGLLGSGVLWLRARRGTK